MYQKTITVLFIVLAAILVYILPIESLEEAPRRCLAIFVMAALLWITEIIPLYITGLAILFAEVVFLNPVLKLPSETYFSPFFSNIIVLFLGGFVLADTLHKFRLDERISRMILHRLGSNPKTILLGLMITSAFLSMWMSNTATAAMMIALSLPIMRGIDADDPYRKALILGIAFACNLGGIGTPIGTPPNAIAIKFMSDHGIEISFMRWVIASLPIALILVIGAWRIILMMYKPKIQSLIIDTKTSEPIGVRQRLLLLLFLITIGLWLTTEIHGMASGVVSMIPIIVIFGSGLMGKSDFKNLSWDILFLMGGGLTLGVAIQESGLSDWVMSYINLSAFPQSATSAIVAFISGTMTSFISNTSTANLLMPMVIGIKGMSLTAVCMAVAWAASASMVLPISTPPNAIAYGSGEIKIIDMLKAGLIVTLFSLIIITTLGYLWWKVLGIV
ncbi:MAG: DASS family sodium-coupled anion symporter [candidate division Zixibacteria bacterium]|nr:DASS family sodium-coupled anion symporter [candidate division Zixibacteria bacterium]